jgi:proteic killer suppression protein
MSGARTPAAWRRKPGDGFAEETCLPEAGVGSARIQLTGVRRRATVLPVRITSFLHKGLKRLYLEDSAKGVPPDAVDKLRAILTFLQDIEDPEKLRAFPLWKAHQLAGDRKGVWNLHVTRNWRLTFQIKDGAVFDVDYEDYH